MSKRLIERTSKGLYCPQADVYIDPWKKVNKALITHGHSDHARWGHKSYLCVHSCVNILKHRLGKDIAVKGLSYGEKIGINGVTFSFHPAGHVRGSAQIRVESRGEIWVVSGDYKVEYDGLAEAYEVVRCNTFITECTFGLPVYRWQPQHKVFEEINRWWHKNRRDGKASVISAYSLGKAQRIIFNVDNSIGPIYTHSAIENINAIYRNDGLALPKTIEVKGSTKKSDVAGALVVAPPAAINLSWTKRFGEYSDAAASGWMAIRGQRRWRGTDRGFVLSDHCDWPALNKVIGETGATRILTTHGNTVVFSQWLNDLGYDASSIDTEFGDEQMEDTAL